MKRLIIMFLGFVLITSCNNNKTGTPDKEKEQKGDNKDDKVENKDKDNGGQYTWTEAEKDKFMKDCERESEENIATDKLKEFCLCMLTESQKYYPSYSQMDQKSNEDDDEEIFKKCAGSYGDQNDH